MPSADEVSTRTAREYAVVVEGTFDLQVIGNAHSVTVLMAPTVAFNALVREIERLRTKARIVAMGKESDGVASAGKPFDVVPDEMNKVHIRFRAASERIDSYNVQSCTEFTICEGVLQRIPDVIGRNELMVKSFQLYKFCINPTMDTYLLTYSMVQSPS